MLKKKLAKLNPNKKFSNLELISQKVEKDIKRVIKVAKTPQIIPCIKKGPRINQLEAPTNLIMEISSLWLKIANLMVLKATKRATIIKIMLIPIPTLLAVEIINDNLSITGFL